MVTRSIVGRFLILAVLLVSLGVIAQAAMIITKGSGSKLLAKADSAQAMTPMPVPAAPAPAAPAAAVTAAEPPATPAPEAAPVRVVYPGPLGDAPTQPRKFADAAPAEPAPQPVALAPQPAPAEPEPAAAAAPAPVEVASAEPQPPPEATPAPSGKGVDLNRASVEVLDHLGGGHIGQSIVQHRPYRSVEDLVKKRVVRRSVYEQIKNQVAAQ